MNKYMWTKHEKKGLTVIQSIGRKLDGLNKELDLAIYGPTEERLAPAYLSEKIDWKAYERPSNIARQVARGINPRKK